MVHGVSRVNAGFTTTEVDGGEKFFNRGVRPQNEVVPVGSSKRDSAKGTSVQTGNPYFAKLPGDYFMELKSSERDDAIRMTNDVRTRLAMAYADVLRENPDALVGVELPPFPEVPTDCKKKDRLDTYLDALRNHEFMVTTLLNEAKDATIVEQVNANTNARAAETRALVETTSITELAAIYSLREDMFNGLKYIANLIETDTHRIITAVDANGNKIMRAINKATNEIKECIVKDGDRTRAQEFINTLGLHQHMDYNTTWLGYKVDEQGQWTRQHVSHEHNITRKFIHDEHEATRSVAHGVPYVAVMPPEVPISPEDGGEEPLLPIFFDPPAPPHAAITPDVPDTTTPSSAPIGEESGAASGDSDTSTGYMTSGKNDDSTSSKDNSNPPVEVDVSKSSSDDKNLKRKDKEFSHHADK